MQGKNSSIQGNPYAESEKGSGNRVDDGRFSQEAVERVVWPLLCMTMSWPKLCMAGKSSHFRTRKLPFPLMSYPPNRFSCIFSLKGSLWKERVCCVWCVVARCWGMSAGAFDVWKYAEAVCAVRCAPFVRDNGLATPRPNAALQHSPAPSFPFPARAQKLPTHFKGK